MCSRAVQGMYLFQVVMALFRGVGVGLAMTSEGGEASPRFCRDGRT
jgi:hypothetical protein